MNARRMLKPILEPLEPLTDGPLAPEAEVPRQLQKDPYEDDKHSHLRDEWRAEEREWLDVFREMCRD